MSNITGQTNKDRQLLTLQEASQWATKFLDRTVTESNISYLIQYGKIKKYNGDGTILVSIDDLKRYYNSYHGRREIKWRKKLGTDLNWALSFEHVREKERTKHVHRLHPYKGKFIPQLVEYFLDGHADDFKTRVYFREGDVILDPFSGSGTTLVQANELNMHSIGIDVSRFNCMIAEVKLLRYNLTSLAEDIKRIEKSILSFEESNNVFVFEKELINELYLFNTRFFPAPEYRYKVNAGLIDEEAYGKKMEQIFLKKYEKLISKYNIKLSQDTNRSFLDKWYVDNVRKEIDFALHLMRQVESERNRKILSVILSRTIRSCRATTHYDLATLKEPQFTTYYCWKHKKMCKPLFSIKYWFSRYANDTLKRLAEFNRLRTDARWVVIPADSRTVDVEHELYKRNGELYKIFKRGKIKGIFTSPPYVGQIDYHEQHAYAYELFGLERKDDLEIGPLYKGQGEEARKSYVDSISKVMRNCKRFLADDFDIFLVANDKYSLYPLIAEESGLKIVNTFKRPVLNRTERDKSPYSEMIFHLKNKQ